MKKNISIILKKLKFIKYFCIFSILLFMLTIFCSTSLLTNSSINIKNDVLNKEIKDLFEKNDEKKKLIYKFLNEFEKEKEVKDLTSGEVGYSSSIQSLGNNKYLVGTKTKGFWFLKFDNDGLVVQANKIQGKDDVILSDLTTGRDVGAFSSIQDLRNNKYLVGTYNKGFWFLKFDNNGLVVQANKIQDKNGGDVPVLTTDSEIGFGSSIQSLGKNKYLVGTHNKGFWLLKFDDDTNQFSIAKKIEGKEGTNVSILTALVEENNSNLLGHSSSIKELGDNKYLVGTKNKGFWLLEFDDDTNQFSIAKKIEGKGGVDVSILTTDGKNAGKDSSIQSLGNYKYLVGTFYNGFYLLKFDNANNKFTAEKIQDLNGKNVSNLTNDLGFVGRYSSIQDLGENKYLVGTGTEGFWFLEFKDDTNQFIANNIEGVEGVDVQVLTDGGSSYSSIQKLGKNKYLVGTGTNGFWFLEFNNDGLVVQTNKIKKLEKVTNDEFDNFYDKNIKKIKNEYKKLQILSNFKSDDDKTFWKEFAMEMFDIDEENKEAKIVDNYSFNKNEIWTEEKLKKFKKFLFKKNVESEVDSGKNNDSKKKDETKIGSGKWKLWFLIMIPIVPIVIYLFILFRKKNKKRINK